MSKRFMTSSVDLFMSTPAHHHHHRCRHIGNGEMQCHYRAKEFKMNSWGKNAQFNSYLDLVLCWRLHSRSIVTDSNSAYRSSVSVFLVHEQFTASHFDPSSPTLLNKSLSAALPARNCSVNDLNFCGAPGGTKDEERREPHTEAVSGATGNDLH